VVLEAVLDLFDELGRQAGLAGLDERVEVVREDAQMTLYIGRN
jgi:hypothetical protein